MRSWTRLSDFFYYLLNWKRGDYGKRRRREAETKRGEMMQSGKKETFVKRWSM